MDFERSKRCWVANGLSFEWDLKSRSHNHLKWAPFCKKPFEIQTKMSGIQMARFQMVGTISILQLKPDYLKSDLQKIGISNVSVFQMVGFQILIPNNYETISSSQERLKKFFFREKSILQNLQGSHSIKHFTVVAKQYKLIVISNTMKETRLTYLKQILSFNTK